MFLSNPSFRAHLNENMILVSEELWRTFYVLSLLVAERDPRDIFSWRNVIQGIIFFVAERDPRDNFVSVSGSFLWYFHWR